MSDSYFEGVPSMQAEERKTAVAFHATDDLAEVRMEVFRLLRDTEGLRFFAVVTDKRRVLEYVRERNESNPDYRYHPNELYNYLVRRLFKQRLHQSSEYRITFSKRGKSDRTDALREALQSAQNRFAEQHNVTSDTFLQVSQARPKDQASLQSVDYFIWALQRLYELGEDKTLYTEIEGIMRLLYFKETGKGSRIGQKEFISQLIAIGERYTGADSDSLLLPQQFLKYLTENVFANFNVDTGMVDLSRHSVAHGAAEGNEYTSERALQGILILDQIYFYTS